MSCDGTACAPVAHPWRVVFAWGPVRANEGWRWWRWLHARPITLGGHGVTRTIWEYREAR